MLPMREVVDLIQRKFRLTQEKILKTEELRINKQFPIFTETKELE